MLTEFDIISRCFDQPGLAAPCNDIVRLGIGDDCAVINVPRGKELVFSMDTLVADIHFPASADPADIAWRALSVNLSDLAAAGATPLVFTLALTLPESDDDWLEEFAGGLREAAGKYQCYLVGGDTSRGPLTLTLQVQGLVDAGKVITRHGAKAGDNIYVSGELGRAALALKFITGELDSVNDNERESLLAAFYRPEPRLALGAAVQPLVSAGMDISDGMLADLGHICRRSACGAEIALPDVPVTRQLLATLPAQEALALALTGGDDYELLLTAAPENESRLLALGAEHGVPLKCVGRITKGSDILCQDENNNPRTFTQAGYRHFT